MRSLPLVMMALALPPAVGAQEGSLADRMRAVLNLPVLTTEAREAGVPDERVSTTIRDIFGAGVPADDAVDILDAEVRAVRDGGSADNFGAYVRSQVRSGVRGRALADAIHAEQARRGIGRPDAAGRPGNAADRPGRAADRRENPAEQRGNAAGNRGNSGNRQNDDAEPRRGNAGARGRQP